MTSMVEKMARAAYESGRKQISVAGIVLPPWDDLTDEMRQAVYPNMIEALKALREPTEAMCAFAEDNFDRNGDNIAG